tara:strand:+ start:716 stop:1042 length:327 start_codon:yes stop_codon:yes gene_type:complete
MGVFFGNGELEELKWVAFSMSNASIHGDRGVSSITRHSNGRHQIVFDGNMAAQGQYALVGNGQYEWSVGPWNNNLNNYEVSQAYTWHGRYAAGTGGDIGYMGVIIMGQ